MSGTNSPQGGLTRRSFLKTTAAAAGATALVGGASLTALANDAAPIDSGEKVFHSACTLNCPNSCGMNVHVREGKAYKVTRKEDVEFPDEAKKYIEYYGYPCLRGRSLIQWLYNPERIQYPMRRIEGTERGAGQWERISWDEAIEEISRKFMSLQKEYGNQSVAMPFLTGHAGIIDGWYGSPRLFANLTGMTDMEYSLDEGWCTGGAYVVGTPWDGAGGYQDLLNSKTIFVWGGNITESHTRTWRWVQMAKERGSRVICVDPRYTISASKSDMHVPLRVGSDSALAMGLIRYLIENDLCNRPYMIEKTCAPFLVKEDGSYLHGAEIGLKPVKAFEGTAVVDPALAAIGATGSDGAYDPIVVWDLDAGAPALETECANPAIEGEFEVAGMKVTPSFVKLRERAERYVPELVGKLCGIDPSWVKILGDVYADGPVAIVIHYGFDHYDNGDVAAQAMFTLQSITGNMAVPGGGIGAFSEGTDLFMMDAAWVYPDAEHFAPECTYMCVPDVIRTGVFNGQPYPIKAFFCLNSNGFSNNVDQKLFLEEILPKLDFVVTADMNMNDTARYSDIVLPATHWFETLDIDSMCDWIELMEVAVEPQFEAKRNYDILTLLAEKMGFGEYFQMTPDEILRHCFDTTPALAENGLFYDDLLEKKVLINKSPDTYPGVNGGYWTTQSGKLEFYNEAPSPRRDVGLNPDMAERRLPDFMPPGEAWPENPLHEKYPITCFQEHSRWRAHTIHYNAPWLRELDPEPVVKMSLADAEKRGIRAGDVVEVFNDRGSVTLRASVDNGLPEGMCNIPKGWQRHQFIAGGYQELTPSRVNARTLNQAFYDVLVDIRKVEA